MKKFAFVALAAMLAFTGCNFDNALLYNQMTMGQVSGSNIVTDEGITYVVTENETESDYTGQERIVFRFDVLEKGTSENTYSIRLLDYATVFVSDPVNKSSQSEEWFGNDGINLESGWFSGEYLNLYLTITMLQGSKTEHRVRLMFDDTADNSDTLHFYLKHNGFGETYDSDSAISKIGRYSTYASFPVKSYIPSGADGINVKVEWDWFKMEGNQYLTEKEHHSESTYYSASSTRADF